MSVAPTPPPAPGSGSGSPSGSGPAAPGPAGPAGPLDLRGTPCPLNFIRTRLALEKIAVGAELLVDLDAGEPETMVSEGVRGDGHAVEAAALPDGGVRLRIRRG